MPTDEWTLTHHRDEYVSAHGIIGYRGPQRSATTLYWNHMPAELIRRRIGKNLWDNYYKFSVIRNPYDKVLSGFYFFRRLKNIPVGAFNIDEEK